jgi:hypothetical protein
MEKWVIIKRIKNNFGVEIPVILLDSLGEVMEYDDIDEANKMRDLFQVNSDSGHIYEVKKI